MSLGPDPDFGLSGSRARTNILFSFVFQVSTLAISTRNNLLVSVWPGLVAFEASSCLDSDVCQSKGGPLLKRAMKNLVFKAGQ